MAPRPRRRVVSVLRVVAVLTGAGLSRCLNLRFPDGEMGSISCAYLPSVYLLGRGVLRSLAQFLNQGFHLIIEY